MKRPAAPLLPDRSGWVSRTLAWLLLAILASSCASLPDVRYLRGEPLSTAQSPSIVGARGELPESKKQALLDGLAVRSGATAMLERHIAAEDAIAGSPLVAGNKVTLLADGPATMRAMMQAIRGARDHIHLESYIIEADAVGRSLADELIRKQAAGVTVRVIYDSVGSIAVPPEYFERLAAAGIDLLEFNPVNPLKAGGNWDINQRDHRKLLVVDGRVAFTGGVNISAVYGKSSLLHNKRSKPPEDARQAAWRDTHMQIEGPAVAEFQKLFIDTWQRKTGQAIAGKRYFPPQKAQGAALVRAIGSIAEQGDYSVYKTYVSALSHAQKYAHLTTAYFVPDQQIVDTLKDAARRGVDVRIIFPSFTDHALILYASRSYYDELLAGGVRIYERNAALLHAKTAVIDDVWSTIGSTNLDMRSFLHNDEINAVVLSTDFAEQMEALFQRDLAESTEITPAQWRERGLGQRLREWVVRLFEYWL